MNSANRFIEAYDSLETELNAIQVVLPGSECIVPVCGKVGLVRGKTSGRYLVRLGNEVYVKVDSQKQAIEILERAKIRLKLSWLGYLEEYDLTGEGLAAYEKKFARPQQSKDVVWDMDGMKEPLFFEPFENVQKKKHGES